MVGILSSQKIFDSGTLEDLSNEGSGMIRCTPATNSGFEDQGRGVQGRYVETCAYRDGG